MVTVIEEWSIIGSQDPFMAPETREIYLVGVVTGHPTKDDGTYVRTSAVRQANGRMVTTASGTEYRLGEPDVSYRRYLEENRPGWDPENPITVK